MIHTYYVDVTGDLCHYDTGETLRRATKRERLASECMAQYYGGAGVITEYDLSRPVSVKKLRRIEHQIQFKEVQENEYRY